MTQDDLAELFAKGRSTIAEHILNIFDDQELNKDSVCRNFRRTAADGKVYSTIHYNLDMILAVGFRVRSPRGVQFRSDPNQPNMGLTSWKGSVVRKGDVSTTKNYLKQDEIEQLNRIVAMYLDYAEDQAKQRKTITMAQLMGQISASWRFSPSRLSRMKRVSRFYLRTCLYEQNFQVC